MIKYGQQNLDEDDIDAVIEVLRSDFLTQGPTVEKFEQLVGSTVKAEYAIAANSATSALHVACMALNVDRGDKVWTSPITFVASANCALYCDAEVDFVDIDPLTNNMDPQVLEKKLKKAEKQNALPTVVIPVHMGGLSPNMKAIKSLADKYGFKIIEDASHAIGASYYDKPVGNCEFSDITIFSFHPVKIITSAEGGIAVTNDKKLADKMRTLTTHGITKNVSIFQNNTKEPWWYEQQFLGYNYRMSELHAALGLSQLKKLHNFISVRKKISDIYRTNLVDCSVELPFEPRTSKSAWHLYIIKCIDTATRMKLFLDLKANDIHTTVHYIPVYKQPYFRKIAPQAQDECPNAESYYNKSLTLPIHPGMTEDDINAVSAVVRKCTNL